MVTVKEYIQEITQRIQQKNSWGKEQLEKVLIATYAEMLEKENGKMKYLNCEHEKVYHEDQHIENNVYKSDVCSNCGIVLPCRCK